MAVTVNEAGRKGGLCCLANQGRAFYVEIGRKGQQIMRAKFPNKASEWGKLGGRPKKLTLNRGGERQIITRGGIADPPDVTPLSPA